MLRRWFISCLLLSCIAPAIAQDSGNAISIEWVSSQARERVFFMDALFKIKLPEHINHAIYNGVPLPLLLQIEVKESNNWWFDTKLVTIEQRYVLHYLSLLDAVRLINVTEGSSSTIGTLEKALQKISVIKNYPFLDREHFNLQNETYARLRLLIDIDSLPNPLKTQAVLGGDWELNSGWKEWVLE